MRTLQRRFALIRRCALGVLLLVPLFFAPGSHPQAAVVTNVDGLATGITGLSVGTNTYNISFETGTYDALFPMGELFTDALSIVEAIAIELNDALFPLIAGSFFEGYAVPESVNDLTSTNVRLGMCAIDSSATFCGGLYTLQSGTSIFLNNVSPTLAAWAVPSAVPLPAALPLFGSALAMLGIVGWRRRRQAGG